MTPTMRRWGIATALIATLAAAQWVGSQDAPITSGRDDKAEAVATARTATEAPMAAPAINLPLNKLKRQPQEETFDDIFASKSWQPPPAPVTAYKPPPPVAPPLPFTYFGKMVGSGNNAVFLNWQDRGYLVKAGDTLGGMYRIEEITPQAVVLTYLPLQQKQSLSISAD